MAKVKPGGRNVYLVLASAGLALVLGAGGLHWYRKAHAVYTHVYLYQKDRLTEVSTAEKTVRDALREQGIRLKPQDVVVPDADQPVTEGMEIDLGLVDRQVKDVKRKIPAAVHTDYTDMLNVGEIIDVQAGQDGLEELRTESYSLNGEDAFEKILKATVLVPEKDSRVLEGTALRQKLYPLKKRAKVVKIIEMEATAYYPGPEDTWPYASGTTASGLKAGYGVVAVDPRFIRLKTPLYIEGYGYAIAADTGGAIKGNKIDLCFDTYEQAVQFGRKSVKVYLLR